MTPRNHHHRHRHGDNHEHLAAMFPTIMELAQHEGNAAVFVIERPDDDTDETTSFSADALYSLEVEMMTFLMSRVMRSWDSTGHPPKALNVQIRVKVDR